jgi:hypothetical protein
MSRRKVTKYKTSFDEMLKTFIKTGSYLKTAKELHLSYKTVRKYLTEKGIQNPRGKPKGTLSKRYGDLMTWVRGHPNVKLPKSYKEIMTLTGLSLDSIKCYIQRRRDEVRDFIKSIPSLKTLEITFVTKSGVKIPTLYFKSYEIDFNKWTLVITIKVVLKNNQKMNFNFLMKDLKGVLNGV